MSLDHIYLVGPPASGKSTVFAELTRGQVGTVVRQPVAHTIWDLSGAVELGVRRDTFSGTDSLAMNGITGAEALVEEQHPPLLIAEGDRLACDRWFEFVTEQGYVLWLFNLVTSDLKLNDRRIERALLDDKPQDKAWIRGRETKIRNLCSRWQHIDLDGERGPRHIVDEMLSVCEPLRSKFQVAA